MGLSLRIDVDNPFGYTTFFKKVLNRVSLDYNMVPHWSSLGFLDNAKRLRNYLEDNSVPATWHFRNITIPHKRDQDMFSQNPFDIALHAERTDTLENFANEAEQWKKSVGWKPKGFSKHGSGDIKLSRKHVMEYDDDTFIEFGIKLGFEYFTGNGTNYQQQFEMKRGLVFMPGVFWLDNITLHSTGATLDSLIEYSKNNSVIVLVHPIWWTIQEEVRDRLKYLVERVEFQKISTQVKGFKDSSFNQ